MLVESLVFDDRLIMGYERKTGVKDSSEKDSDELCSKLDEESVVRSNIRDGDIN